MPPLQYAFCTSAPTEPPSSSAKPPSPSSKSPPPSAAEVPSHHRHHIQTPHRPPRRGNALESSAITPTGSGSRARVGPATAGTTPTRAVRIKKTTAFATSLAEPCTRQPRDLTTFPLRAPQKQERGDGPEDYRPVGALNSELLGSRAMRSLPSATGAVIFTHRVAAEAASRSTLRQRWLCSATRAIVWSGFLMNAWSTRHAGEILVDLAVDDLLDDLRRLAGDLGGVDLTLLGQRRGYRPDRGKPPADAPRRYAA